MNDRAMPPITGLVPLLDAQGLRDADAAAARLGIPSIVLMERAGWEATRAIREDYPAAREAVILVGPGNNGGDGMVVARHLRDAGMQVRVVSRDGTTPATPDGATVSSVASRLGIAVAAFSPDLPPPDGVVIDALLGTGRTAGPLRGTIAAMVEWANACGRPVVALDVPSGVDASTGEVEGTATRAALTVTFHADTVGLRVAPGRHHAGSVVVADIGIPRAVSIAPAAWSAGPEVITAVPARAAEADKYRAGAVMMVAGCRGMAGAARLAAQGAMRAGAGLVVVAVPQPADDAVAHGMPEAIVLPLTGGEGHLSTADVDLIMRQTDRCVSLVIGPGLGRNDDTGRAVRQILARCPVPAVVDADALWHLQGHLDVVASRRAATVLTPHTGEAARLLVRDRPAVDDHRLEAAAELAEASGATVLLKGPGTIVATAHHAPIVVAEGGAELATAGSGDVLSGVVGALMASGLGPEAAATCGAALHARAGAEVGRGALAGDIAAALPEVLTRWATP